MAKLFLLVALVGFLALVTETDASCSNEEATCEASTQFEEGCFSCSCNSDGTVKQCCTSYITPTKVTEGCITSFDEANCVYRVFNPNDSNAVCQVLAAVG